MDKSIRRGHLFSFHRIADMAQIVPELFPPQIILFGIDFFHRFHWNPVVFLIFIGGQGLRTDIGIRVIDQFLSRQFTRKTGIVDMGIIQYVVVDAEDGFLAVAVFAEHITD